MDKNVRKFLLEQGLTERDLEYKPNFTFVKVELMLQKALQQVKNTVDLANVSKSVCKMCGDLEQIYKEGLCMICYDDEHGM